MISYFLKKLLLKCWKWHQCLLSSLVLKYILPKKYKEIFGLDDVMKKLSGNSYTLVQRTNFQWKYEKWLDFNSSISNLYKIMSSVLFLLFFCSVVYKIYKYSLVYKIRKPMNHRSFLDVLILWISNYI